MQMLLPSRNMEKEHAKWKFNFKREEKYCYASQAALQMSSNEFRIIPFRLISSSARKSTNRMEGQGGIGIVVGGYLCWTWGNTRSPRYQYLPCLHSNNTWRSFISKACSHSTYPSHPAQGFKDIWKITKEPRMRKDQAITKYQRLKKRRGKGLRSSVVKLSIIKCQISKERLEGIDKRRLGNQWRNLGKKLATFSWISEPTPKYSYIQTWKTHNTITTHSQDPKPTHSQKFQTSPAIQMELTQAWKAPPRKLSHEMQQSSISHTAPIIISDSLNFSQTSQVMQIHCTA